MAISRDEVTEFINERLTTSLQTVEEARFIEARANYSKSASQFSENTLLGNEIKFCDLANAWGMAGFAVVLSVDLRNSSKRAWKIGAKKTYVTMHSYLPTMAKIVGSTGGKIVGLRGDGLIGIFGFVENPREETSKFWNNTVSNATDCGQGMLEAIQILNPLLDKHEIPSDLRIGVGIDFGEVVVTKIGWMDSVDITLYGPAVNHACKFSNAGDGEILYGKSARDIYPKVKNGRTIFRPHPGAQGAFVVKFPPDYVVLTESKMPRRIPK